MTKYPGALDAGLPRDILIFKERFRVRGRAQLVDHDVLRSGVSADTTNSENKNKKPEDTKAVMLAAKIEPQ